MPLPSLKWCSSQQLKLPSRTVSELLGKPGYEDLKAELEARL